MTEGFDELIFEDETNQIENQVIPERTFLVDYFFIFLRSDATIVWVSLGISLIVFSVENKDNVQE